MAQAWTGHWGDQGNGTYINPVLDADYSDPDVIRVGEKYYMVCSDFHFMGLPVLESDDMVNWKIIAQVFNRLDFPEYDSLKRYGEGSWAPSLRFHDGKFFLYFCTAQEGLFMSTAADPAGPWSPLINVRHIKGWEDPCPFWDDDGNAYLGHSLLGAGPIILHRMSADGTRLLDDGATIYTGPVAEGTKFLRKDGYYYLSIPEGGVGQGWQTVLRSKNLYGPYEKKVVLETGSTQINGPHQGALVETPAGQWWFYHFQSAGPMGRVVHLEPVLWKDGWPLVGVDIDRNGIGEPVYVWKKPDVGKTFPINAPQTDDEFSSPVLGLQWQWNHNPVNSAWSLTEKPGWLALHALQADDLMKAHNTLTQKIMGETGVVTTLLSLDHLQDGQRTGLSILSNTAHSLVVYTRQGVHYLSCDGDEIKIGGRVAYLQVRYDFHANTNHFFYSTDNKLYKEIGNVFRATDGNWKGARIALFSYNMVQNSGTALFDWVHYDYDGPKGVN